MMRVAVSIQNPKSKIQNFALCIAVVARSSCLFSAEQTKESATAASLLAKDDVDKSIDAGLDWLAKQQRNDGSWPGAGGTTKHQNAITGLSVMAFMAAGHVPGEGKYGKIVQKAIDFIATQQAESGYFGAADDSRMYGHGICTLALVEALGIAPDRAEMRKLKPIVERALALTLKAQAVPKSPGDAGGWRYHPTSGDSDLSLTGWQIMSLRGAQDCGFKIPTEAVDRALKYVRSKYDGNGGFGYQSAANSEALRGLGMIVLQLLGQHDSAEAKASAQAGLHAPLEWSGTWFFYGLYYLTQGMNQVGGSDWETFRGKMEALLTKNQRNDGSWGYPPNSQEPGYAGPVFPTAMAVLTLSARYKVLPIYQR